MINLWLLRINYMSQIILTPTHHQRSPAHHIVPCTTLLLHTTHGLHFPSTIALITHLSPITHCTDTQLALITHFTKALDFPSLTAEYCFATSNLSEPFSLFISVVDYLNCLLVSDRLLPAFFTLPAF